MALIEQAVLVSQPNLAEQKIKLQTMTCVLMIFYLFLFDRPQNVPRLYDLVRVKDDQIRTAFYFALRNTLVANDLKQATDIAYQVEPLNVVVFL